MSSIVELLQYLSQGFQVLERGRHELDSEKSRAHVAN
jgi:hypothetical protein